MFEISIFEIAVLCFLSAFSVHQISRKLLGQSADVYFSSVAIAGAFVYLILGGFLLTVSAISGALLGHILSVNLSRKFPHKYQ